MLAFIDAKGYRLRNRHGTNTTVRYPEFDFLVDCPREPSSTAKWSCSAMVNRISLWCRAATRRVRLLKIRTLSQAEPATFMAFDLLYENYSSLLAFPLLERRQRLERLLGRLNHPSSDLFTWHRGPRASLVHRSVLSEPGRDHGQTPVQPLSPRPTQPRLDQDQASVTIPCHLPSATGSYIVQGKQCRPRRAQITNAYRSRERGRPTRLAEVPS